MNGGLHRVCTSEGWVLGEILYIWAVCSAHVCAHACTHTAFVQGVRAPLAYAAAFLGRGGSVRSPHVCASAWTKLRGWFGGCISIFLQPGGAIGCVLATMSPGRLCHACAAGSGSTGSACVCVYVPHPAAVHQLVGNREAALP